MTNTLKRTDEHRPSVIRPDDYAFVGMEYQDVRNTIGGDLMLAREMEIIRAHMARTGGAFSAHEHGGACMICGASFLYSAIFYHELSNSYIRTGLDCAEKLHMGDPARFRAFKRDVSAAREARAGKLKAQGILADAGLTRAWEIYASGEHRASILDDMVRKLVKYGSLSEKQITFLRTLVERYDNAAATKAQRESAREAERAAALPAPEGKQTVRVEVIKTECRESQYGETLKMLVKHSDGWLAWGTVPSALEIFNLPPESDGYCEQRGLKRGDVVEFTATFERSRDDEKFGFFKRPRKASVVEFATAA